MSKAPCGHPAPLEEGCQWCAYALRKDRRYLPRWWPRLHPRGPGATPPRAARGPTPRPSGGPGAELAAMLAELGIAERPGCKCKNRAARMDAWGVGGCRLRRDEIVGWLLEEWAGAGGAVDVGGGVLEALGRLADEAIRRAEARGAEARGA